jgi:ATP-dependent helicase/DNAse subunit B
VLGVRAPDDLVLQPDVWLSPLDRGLLLHRVFERSLRRGRESNVEPESAGFEDIVQRALDGEVARWRARVPPPGAAVYDREVEQLRIDARAFARMARESEGRWLDVERSFGRRGDPPAVIDTQAGRLRVMGAIDRIDETPDGSLVVIDYKTGTPFGFDRGSGTYNGGRRLQHVVYSKVAESLLDRRVGRAEYHFPSVRGENAVRAFGADRLRGGLAVIDALLDIAARGHFHATFDASDCKLCDYRAVCRVTGEGAGTPISPVAEQAAAGRDEVEEYGALARLRGLVEDQ